ncbi:MAG: rhodanese-like domain-containing protein [Bryobacteraceae bacterium]
MAYQFQLVQGMDKYAATKRARVVLVDNHLVRALMTASWLVQADWPDTYVLADPFAGVELATGDYKPTVLKGSQNVPASVSPAELSELLKSNRATLVDVSASSSYSKAHVPGAWFVIRARLAESIKMMGPSERFVVTGENASLAAFTAHDLATLTGKPVSVLAGGNAAWRKAGLPVKSGMEKPGSVVDDIFAQPAPDAYFSWELQLPEQLDRAKETDFKLAGQ